MEHSIHAYLERRSSAELVSLLKTCMLLEQWERYVLSVPQIFAILESRNVRVSERIKLSWEAFLCEAQSGTEDE